MLIAVDKLNHPKFIMKIGKVFFLSRLVILKIILIQLFHSCIFIIVDAEDENA